MTQFEQNEADGLPPYQRAMDLFGLSPQIFRNMLLDQNYPVHDQIGAANGIYNKMWRIADFLCPENEIRRTASMHVPSNRLKELELVTANIGDRIREMLLHVGEQLFRHPVRHNHIFVERIDPNTFELTKTHFELREIKTESGAISKEILPKEERLTIKKNGKVFSIILGERKLTLEQYNAVINHDEEREVEMSAYIENPTPSSRAINRFFAMMVEGMFGKIG